MADPVSLAITVALTAAQMALQASRKIEGPRLDDMSVTVADYGTPLNYFYGKRKFEGLPIIWAEPLREVKTKSKTKGGKYANYSYFGTWAVAIADHQIEGVTRLWFDKHLVYDATGSGPITPFALSYTSGQSKSGRARTSSVDLADHMRIYLGTATQDPDPRMEATLDAALGAGSTPAYRGVSYIIFEEVPLEKFGNRIPQIAGEAVSLVAPSYPYETHTTALAIARFSFSPDGSRMLIAYNSAYEIWDTAARTKIVGGTLPYATGTNLAVSNSGSIYYVTGDIGPFGNDSLVILNPDGLGTAGTVLMGMSGGFVQCLADTNGKEYILAGPSLPTDSLFVYPVDGSVATGTVSAPGFVPKGFFPDAYGDIWAAGSATDGSTGNLLKVIEASGRTSPDSVSVVGAGGGSPGAAGGIHNPLLNQYFFRHQSSYYVFDDTTLSQTATGTWNGATTQDFLNRPPASSVWTFGGGAAKKISTADGSVLQTASYGSWAVSTGASVYEPVTNALVGLDGAGHINWLFLDRIGGSTVTLGDICADVCSRAGIDAANVSTSALTQTINGYSWTQGPAKDIIEPLLDAYDSDVFPHDFTVKFGLRGGTPSATVSDFVKDGDNRYEIAITQDTDLPRSVAFSFADLDADQQTNTALVTRPLDAIDGARELSLNMTTLALTSTEAKQLAERWFRRKWFGRESYTLGLTMQDMALEPCDLRTLTLDDMSRKARLLSSTFQSSGVIRTVWERDDPSIAVLSTSTGAAMDGRVPSTISISSLSKGVVLDVPLAVDAHNQTNPMMYYGAASYSGTWFGADIWQSDDSDIGNYSGGWAAIASNDAMDWGYTTNTLSDGSASVIDYAHTVNVVMKSGTLTSSTETAILADASLNLALLGQEYIQFITATLESDGSYTLSGLVRGARGTEQHTGTHSAGDDFIVFNTYIFRRDMSASEIGDTDYYRTVSQGRTLESGSQTSVAYTAAALKPYSPVHGVATLSGGDWTITATRRTRIGGATLDGTDVPLGETSESWSLDILNGSTVVRTITGTSLPLTWTAAQQSADFGSAQSTIFCNLYQVSPALSLRGFPLAIAA